MPVNQRTWDATGVWTPGSETDLFHPLGPALETTGIKAVRPRLELRQTTGNLTASAAYELSNDGIAWSSQTTIGGGTPVCSADANGIVQADEFTDVSAALFAARFVRFGVHVRNTDDGVTTDKEMANVSMTLDVRDA